MSQNMLLDLQERITNTYNKVLEQREEILSAFIAKYNLQPDEVEQVVQRTPEGATWFVRKREKEPDEG